MVARRHLNVLIDGQAIYHNASVLRRACHQSGADLMAVVKTDAYGHGAVDASRAALAAGASWLGVCTTGEAQEIRQAGIDAPILAWLHNSADEIHHAVAADVDVSVSSRRTLGYAATAINVHGRPARVHLEIDTGLSRSGAGRAEVTNMLRYAAQAQAHGQIQVVSVWSHLSHGEVREHGSLDRQARRLADTWRLARELGLQSMRHLASSLPTLTRPDLHFDLARTGAALYGLLPPGERHNFGLLPAMRVTSRVALVKRVSAGQGVSYEHDWVTPTQTTLALVPVGYADGIPRGLSGRMTVSINGRRSRIVGRICMDQLIVDCCDDQVAEGDEVVLLGSENAGEPTVHDWASVLQTTPCEVTTNFGRRHTNRQLVQPQLLAARH